MEYHHISSAGGRALGQKETHGTYHTGAEQYIARFCEGHKALHRCSKRQCRGL